MTPGEKRQFNYLLALFSAKGLSLRAARARAKQALEHWRAGMIRSRATGEQNASR
jgi:hypothetical protein